MRGMPGCAISRDLDDNAAFVGNMHVMESILGEGSAHPSLPKVHGR